ncbi:MAG: porin family protein [Flavobacteriaceae bacterium]
MRSTFLLLFFGVLWGSNASAQEALSLDKKYKEDQFYVGISYNFLFNKPDDVTERNLSYGLKLGFIKDISLNYNRTIALGIGMGYAVNSYYSNLLAVESGNAIHYSVIDSNDDFKRNKVETHLIEMPFEIRWRNSTASEYKFWRIYAGFKLGYLLGGRSKFVSEQYKRSFFNADIQKLHYGLTFNFGYNTFNIHAYYSLNNLFNDNVTVNGEDITLKPLRIGLIFYIL